MLTGTVLINELVDELNELKLSTMAATLDDLYHKPGFLEMDRLTLIAELIGPQFQEKVSTTLKNRLTAAHLKGSPEELSDCVDSDKREYLPAGITEVLSSFDFIERGYNLCILGESDAGKSYLAKAIGIKACNRYNVGYFHSEELLESMVALKEQDYDKYARKMKKYLKWELIILDDFLLHTITDEREIKILFELLEKRNEQRKSTIVCSQRDPDNWKAMILNDETAEPGEAGKPDKMAEPEETLEQVETAKIKETAQTEKTAGTDEQSEPGEIQMEIPDEIMRPDETVNADQKLPFTDPRKEAVEKTEISQEQDDVIRSLLTCISKDRLADFHNALVLFFGEDIGKELYQEAKNSSAYAICRVNQTAISEEEKFDVYCQTVFAYSDPKMDCPEDFSSFLYKANTKRKNLNSLRAALQGHYGKDKGMKYYSLFKSHIKIMNRM